MKIIKKYPGDVARCEYEINVHEVLNIPANIVITK